MPFIFEQEFLLYLSKSSYIISMKNTKLFVYGTLKKGYGNHHVINKAKFLGTFISVDKFDMSGYGFPEIYPNKHGKQIMGEIYDLCDQDFVFTDSLEGNGSFYRREIRDFTNNKETIKAWIYIILSPGSPIEVEDEVIDWNYNLT